MSKKRDIWNPKWETEGLTHFTCTIPSSLYHELRRRTQLEIGATDHPSIRQMTEHLLRQALAEES